MKSTKLTRFAWLSIAAALLTIALKAVAYFITGSVGLLSDALESLVNLAAALMALAMLTIAALPADELHSYGHSKAEYFSSGMEGALILLAAAGIFWTAIPRLYSPQPLEQVGLGLVVSAVASVINLAVARVLLRAGREKNSITLEADGHHLMTDVWTSAGVIAGIAAVHFTGWTRLDPIIALVVAINIIFMGVRLMRQSALGMMDTALSAEEQDTIKRVLGQFRERGVIYHAFRTRQAGVRKFISLHVLVPPDWTVQRGHDLLEELERDIRSAVPGSHVFTHLEPAGDPASLNDIDLDRS